jgi:hypothetical protein
LNGQLHREDGPAIEWADGSKYWWVNDQRHREDGPAIERADGSKEWYLNGQLHREDGPACEYADGSKYWYLNDQLHREDGPAVEYADGTKFWYLNGERMSEEEFKQKIEEKCGRHIMEENEILEYAIGRINSLTEDLAHMDLNDQWLVRHETLVKIEELRKIIAFIGGY